MYDCNKLVKVCNEFAFKNFVAIVKLDGFKMLEVDYVKFLLSSKRLKVSIAVFITLSNKLLTLRQVIYIESCVVFGSINVSPSSRLNMLEEGDKTEQFPLLKLSLFGLSHTLSCKRCIVMVSLCVLSLQ